MSHYLLIESNTTGTGGMMVDMLLSRGDAVTFLTRTPAKYPFLGYRHPELQVREVDTNSFGVVIEAVQAIHATKKLHAVTTSSEFYVPLVAQLAAALGVNGLDPAAARTCRHKPSTRQALKAAGLVTPDFYLVNSEEEVRRLAAQIEYPCVVKPPSDSSSHGVRLVNDARDLVEHYLEIHNWKENVRGQTLDGSVLVESLLEGPEYSVETITLAGGETHVIGVTDKHLSQEPWFVELGHDFPSRASAEVQAALKQAAVLGLKAVNFNFGPAHTEIRWTQHGAAIVEINPRLAGGMIPELVAYATGIDLLQTWMDMLVGRKLNLDPTEKDNASIRFITSDRIGTLRQVKGLHEASVIPSIRDIAVTAKPGRAIRPAEDAYDRLGYVIGAGEDPVVVSRHLQEALETIQLELEPQECAVHASQG